MQTVTTAASYGAPPYALNSVGVGVGVQANPNSHPVVKWGFSAYAVALIAVATIYFIWGRK